MDALDSNQYNKLYRSANYHLETGEYQQAILQYRKILAGLQHTRDIAPSIEYEKVNIWGNLGTAYWMLRDMKHAIAAISKAVDLAIEKQYPKLTVAKLYINLAKCFQITCSDEEVECLKKAALFGSKEAMTILNQKGIHHLILSNPESNS